jgi:hypothetical protein
MAHRARAETAHGLVHGGQPRRHDAAELDVVEAGDGHVTGTVRPARATL